MCIFVLYLLFYQVMDWLIRFFYDNRKFFFGILVTYIPTIWKHGEDLLAHWDIIWAVGGSILLLVVYLKDRFLKRVTDMNTKTLNRVSTVENSNTILVQGFNTFIGSIITSHNDRITYLEEELKGLRKTLDTLGQKVTDMEQHIREKTY